MHDKWLVSNKMQQFAQLITHGQPLCNRLPTINKRKTY